MSKGLKQTFLQRRYTNERCAASLLRTCKSKPHLFTPIRMPIIKQTKKTNQQTKGSNNCWGDVEKLEPLCIANGNVKWCSRPGKQFRCSSKS